MKDTLERYKLLLDALRFMAEDDTRLSSHDIESINTHLDLLEEAIMHPTKLKLV